MCGIAGIVEPKGRAGLECRWREAATRMAHRGPDATRHVVRDIGPHQCLLGHQRLAIVDLNAVSDQPMVRDNIDMVFNGEIYNFRALRSELAEQGLDFDTAGDTEVLLQMFRTHGNRCFSDLDGMWAVAFLDRERRKLTLSRDFFGEKPLYYLHDKDRFAFSSDALALCKLDGVPRPLNPEFVTHFIRSGYAPPDCGAFEGIRRLEPRQTLVLDLESMTVAINDRAPLFDAPVFGTEGIFDMNRFEEIFAEALQTRLLADVPVGLMLSGGIDSSYVAAVARRTLDYPLECLTIRYGHGSEVETGRARHVAKSLGLPHHVVEVPQEALTSLVEDAVPSMDEPISDVAYPLLLRIIGAAPPQTRVLLTGDGADELFLSYANYQKYLRCLGQRPGGAGAMGARIGGALSDAPEPVHRLWRWLATQLLPMSATEMLETDLALESGTWKRDRLGTGQSPAEQAAVLYDHAFTNVLAEYLLVKSDRASMWHSKEFRTPYLSRALLHYVAGCSAQSLPRGVKTPIVTRLTEMLGEDLAFAKRGMFAKGERAFETEPLRNPAGYRLPCPHTPQERYRHLVLRKWIEWHQPGTPAVSR